MGRSKRKFSEWSIVEWITRIFIGAVLTIYILISPEYTVMEIGKHTLFRYVFGIYGVLLLISVAEGILTGSISVIGLWNKIRPQTVGQYCMIAYFVLTIISAVLSEYGNVVWTGGSRREGAWTIGLYILAFYGVAKFSDGECWVVYLLSATVSVFSILCIVQLVGCNPFGLYPEGYNYNDAYKAYSGAYIGTIGNVDFVSGFLCLAVGSLWFYFLLNRGRVRFLFCIPILLGLYVLLKIQVLSGIVGLAMGTIVALPFVMPWSMKLRRCYFVVLGILAFLGISVLYLYDYGEGFLHELHQLFHGKLSDRFGTGRFYIWRNVLERIPEHLFFGTGPDTMIFAGIEPFQRYDLELGMQLTAYIDAAHNEYLNILYHQGLFAFLSYLVALGDILIRWMKRGWIHPLSAIWGGAVLCYLIQAFFNISQFVYTPVFWVSLGLLENILCKTFINNLELKRRKHNEKVSHPTYCT